MQKMFSEGKYKQLIYFQYSYPQFSFIIVKLLEENEERIADKFQTILFQHFIINNL